jgi:hypothetical protein
MKNSAGLVLLLCQSLIAVSAWPQVRDKSPEASEPKSTVTIEGLVRDVACPIQNPEATATHLSMKCLKECAKNGSPLVILTKDGELYFPISNKMPDVDERKRLLPFLGKYVVAKGTLYERKGTRAIVIAEIAERKDVPLTVEN